jgi:ribonuclease HI
VSILVYADGGCLDQGTPTAKMYGSYKIVLEDGSVFAHESQFPINSAMAKSVCKADTEQPATNNVAECVAMMLAMEKAFMLTGGEKDVVFLSDSLLVVNCGNGVWKNSTDGLHLTPFIDRMQSALARMNGNAPYGTWSLDKIGKREIVAKLGH